MQEDLIESLGDLDEGLPEPQICLLPVSWRRREEILPLFNEEETQRAAKEEPQSLFLSHYPQILRRCKKAIGWQISDLKGINPLVCTHHIYMEDEAKPVRQPQRRLNPHMQEVVRAEVLKLLQAGIIYPYQIAHGEKMSLHASLQLEGGMEYRLQEIECSDKEGPFPLPFIDQVLERVSGHHFYCFLDGYSVIWERIMEVFMDDITIYGSAFDECLVNLEAVLNRCIEKDLVLNWEKCHFMVQQGIVLGHIISKQGIEVDKAKVELIVKLPSQQMSKECQRSFEELKLFLTTAPIVRAPNWQLPFEQDIEWQRNYTTTEKELLFVVFALDKFRAYLVGSFIVVFTDHSALKSKTRKSGECGSRPPFKASYPINDDFPEESLMLVEVAPWYAHIANYLVQEKFQIIRKCVPEEEQQGILSHCHENACGGHFASQKTTMRVLQWVSIGHHFSKMPTPCVRVVIDARGWEVDTQEHDAFEPILIVDLFYVWGIDFMDHSLCLLATLTSWWE
ncbi:hypothetical protein CK203_112461 [Vitis vinifera]|uniref:Uncharacterized protein n=1 Tax=Vitis vinifera TaxID=29760 RepID=A0A438CWY1_VITVI|nr:hypothetical protein CK203_112461 [Vitis vinifera]